MTVRNRPHIKAPPTTMNDPNAVMSWLRQFYDANRATRHGKFDCTTEITLTINVASTALSDYRISPNSVIFLMPTTANAAAEWGNGTMYIGARGDGTCTITHANNANADRTFAVTILG